MAFSPITLIANQYEDFETYWLKCYEQGTTTPITMYNDAAGTTPFAKLEVGVDGFFLSSGGAIINPHVGETFDAYLFPTEAEADSNTVTANSPQIADNIEPAGTSTTSTKSYLTLDEAVADAATLRIGQTIYLEERSTGAGGGAHWSVIASTTNNTYNIVDTPLNTAISLSLIIEQTMFLSSFGGTDGALIQMRTLVSDIKIDVDLTANESVVFSSDVDVELLPGFTITPSLGLAGGKVFAFETNNVTTRNLTFDGAGETFTPATGNTWVVFGGDGATKYNNHRHHNLTVNNASFSDGNTGATNEFVTHAIYYDNVDDVTINDFTVDTISGACIFFRDCNGIAGKNHNYTDFRWYAFNIEEGVSNGLFENLNFYSGTPEGCFWGGGLNIVSDNSALTAPKTSMANNITFLRLHFEGAYSYGAMGRIQSGDDITVKDVTGDNLSMGSAGIPNQDFTGFRVLTRGINASNKQKPCKNIVFDNIALPGPSGVDGKRHLIYADNDYWSQITTGTSTITVVAAAGTFTRSAGSYLTDGFEVGDEFTPSGHVNAGNEKTRAISAVTEAVITTTELTGLVDETGDGDEVIVTDNYLNGITVRNCKGYSPDNINYWEDGAIFHGLDGGINGITHEDNYYEVRAATSPAVNGGIGYVSNSSTAMVVGKAGGNHVKEMGTATSSYHLGIGYDANCDIVQTKPNTLENHYYDTRTFANSITDKIDDNVSINNQNTVEVYAVNPSRFGTTLTGSKTYDPPSLASGAFTFTDVTVTGSAISNRVESTFSLNQDGVIFTSYVRTANSTRTYLENKDTATKDLASGTLENEVFR